MKTPDLDTILQKKNAALDKVSEALDKAITKTYTSGKNISEETKTKFESYKSTIKTTSKEKIDTIIEKLQKLSDELAEVEKEETIQEETAVKEE